MLSSLDTFVMEDDDNPGVDPSRIPLPPSASTSVTGSGSRPGSPMGNLAGVDGQEAAMSVSDQAAAEQVAAYDGATEVDRAARVHARNSGNCWLLKPKSLSWRLYRLNSTLSLIHI